MHAHRSAYHTRARRAGALLSGALLYRCAVGALSLLVATILAQALPAQERAPDRRTGSVPRDVARTLASVWNASNTRRVRGDFSLAAGDTIRTDVAVLGGRARIAGVIAGQLVVINGDVTLADDSRVTGAVTVVGGDVSGRDRAAVDGETRVWQATVQYRDAGDTLIVAPEPDVFSRLTRWRGDANAQKTQLYLTSAHTYNRVEGLPVYAGPRFFAQNGSTRVSGELFGIFRTIDRLQWTPESRGHRVQFEVQQGRRRGALIGGRLYNEVTPVEDWQLTNTEVGLASFLFTRDYRDYWQRHGGSGHVSIFTGRGSELRGSLAQERWSSRTASTPWSLINRDEAWRANPASDDGVMHLITLSGRLDTRNDIRHPRTGWLLRADSERGDGTITHVATSTPGIRLQAAGDVTYQRGLLDVRRYTRLGPSTQINMRAVAAGWLGGDALPMQRRVSVSGIDALPGFDFRQSIGETDAGTCATGDAATYAQLGRPAQCDRMVLVQVEWKGDFRINLFGRRDRFGDRRWTMRGLSGDGNWVVFANGGRGWLVGDTPGAGHFPKGRLPNIGSWRSDLGGGLDFGAFGVYVAEAVSIGGLQPNVYVRLGHRF